MTQPGAMAPARALTRGTLLGRNVLLNLGGSVLPGIAFLVAVPILVRALGDARFGVLALGWTALGYFSLFDLGIGRAVTQAVADRLGDSDGRAREVGDVIRASLSIIVPIGVLAGAALFLTAPWLTHLLDLPTELRAEATRGFRALACAVPFATAAGVLRGALEAHQYFGWVNALRVPLGLVTFLGPLATLPFTRSVVPPLVLLSAGRAALTIASYVAVVRAIPGVRHADGASRRIHARSLLKVGGWMQVSAVVSPLMVTLDRFVIGAVLGVGLVTYYMTPQELVTKLWMFNIAVLPVFFSAVSLTGTRDPERTVVLVDKLLRVTIALLFLPTLFLVTFAPEILRVWLGPTFAEQSTLVMQLCAIAVFVNCLAQGAMALVQGLGRADVTGKLHLAELPAYAALLWALLPRYGILGAAIAWSARHVMDTAALLLATRALLPPARPVLARIGLWTVLTVAALSLGAMLDGGVLRMALMAVMIPAWIYVCWNSLITPQERSLPLRSLIAVLRPERA